MAALRDHMINAYCGQAAKFAFDPLSLLPSLSVSLSPEGVNLLGSPHAEFRAVGVKRCSLRVCHVVVGKSLADFDKKIVAGRLSTIQHLFQALSLVTASMHPGEYVVLVRHPTHERKPH